jgi:cell division septal protein FtsQ
MGRYQQPTSVAHRPEWDVQRIRKSFFLLVLVLLVVAAVHWGIRTLEHSGVFVVRRVVVQGNRISHEAQIRTLAAVQHGDQLFSVIPKDVEGRVRQHPWIGKVQVERVWPETVTIRVYEHRPLAMINFEEGQQGLYYFGYDETVFAPVEPLQDIDYPVITGVPLADEKGEFSDLDLRNDEITKDARAFLRVAAKGHPILPLQSISEVHVDNEKGIIVYLVEHPFPIYIGYGNVEKRYYQLVKLFERLYRKKKIEGIKEIRMDYHEGRILVAKSEP